MASAFSYHTVTSVFRTVLILDNNNDGFGNILLLSSPYNYIVRSAVGCGYFNEKQDLSNVSRLC